MRLYWSPSLTRPSAAESSPARKARNFALCSRRNLSETRRLPPQLDRLRIHHVQPRPVQPHVVANLPGQQRMLLRGIVADQQNRGRIEDVAPCWRSRPACRAAPPPGQGSRRCGDDRRCWSSARRARTSRAGKLSSFVVRVEPITPIAAPPSLSRTSAKLLSDQLERFFPSRRSQLAVLANQRLRQALFVIARNRKRSGP